MPPTADVMLPLELVSAFDVVAHERIMTRSSRKDRPPIIVMRLGMHLTGQDKLRMTQ